MFLAVASQNSGSENQQCAIPVHGQARKRTARVAVESIVDQVGLRARSPHKHLFRQLRDHSRDRTKLPAGTGYIMAIATFKHIVH